jgi:methyl halide transferase
VPRDWESCYRNDETPWDKGRGAPPLEEMIAKLGARIFGGEVLVPGCGLGHDVRVIASRGFPVLGLDLSETAVRRAMAIPSVADERYEVGDFLDPAWWDTRRFSAIWEHTCFCAIDPGLRDAYAAAAAALLAPGGLLTGVFYLNPHDPGEAHEGPPFETSIAELDQRFGQHFERIAGWVPEESYPGREGREWVAVYRKLPHPRVAPQTAGV